MSEQQWHTVSLKVNTETLRNLDFIKKREGIARNKILADLVKERVRPLTDPDVIVEGQGMPTAGINRFQYVPETDSFVWQFVRESSENATVLADDASYFYLQNLKEAIDKALAQRNAVRSKVKKNEVLQPSGIRRYKVKPHAGKRPTK